MTLMRNGSRPSIGKPAMCHARKERVLLVGTDQRITSGPAAITAAFKGRIHGCTRTLRKTSDSPLAPRAPSIHGTDQRITSGPAAITAAFKGRIHGCTRTLRKTSDSPLAPRAPSIHGTSGTLARLWTRSAIRGISDI